VRDRCSNGSPAGLVEWEASPEAVRESHVRVKGR
jgi:hypothetical protein